MMQPSISTEMKILASGFAMGESPRWHEGRLWLSDWGAQQIVAVAPEGNKEVVVRVPFALPFCFDWLADGRLIVVSGREGLLYCGDNAGSLSVFADLTGIAPGGWNEIVVDGHGNAYVNSGPAIALVTAEGAVRRVAEGGAFPNGMAVTADNSTLIMAESHGRKLTAFDIQPNGDLAHRRVWADLENGVPDGICIDAEGAVWYADVPNKCCVRVREGGEVLARVELDRGGFACMLGGAEGKTLFIVANEWRGMEKMGEVALARTGQVLTVDVSSPGAGWPGRS